MRGNPVVQSYTVLRQECVIKDMNFEKSMFLLKFVVQYQLYGFLLDDTVLINIVLYCHTHTLTHTHIYIYIYIYILTDHCHQYLNFLQVHDIRSPLQS